MTTSVLDPGGAIKAAFDDATQTLKVSIGSLTLTLDPTDDGVAVYGSDGSTKIILKTDSSGKLQVDIASVSTASVTTVPSSATNTTLLASNANRNGASFYNDSTQTVYLKLGATATSSDFTVKLESKDYYELPLPVYTGVIDAIWVSANGNMNVTEL